MPQFDSALTATPRSLRATWWVTISGIIFFELVMLLLWVPTVDLSTGSFATTQWAALSGVLWCTSTLLPLFRYRELSLNHDDQPVGLLSTPALGIPFFFSILFGLLTLLADGLWVFALFPVVQVISLLRWPPGVRMRVTLLATLILACTLAIDWQDFESTQSAGLFMLAAYAVIMPAITVFSLWWWDVVVTLNDARIAESELTAARERLRFANDLHDLQGHHLQVVALQLELAERTIAHSPETARQHLHEARETVATAQQGTRELAQNLRPIDIRTELENAAELLRATGASVELSLPTRLPDVPEAILAPVIRETTTNVLRHGGGKWAQIHLSDQGSHWQFSISNDVPAHTAGHSQDPLAKGGGSGMHSIRQRIDAVDGDLELRLEPQRCTVTVSLPKRGDI